MDSLIYGLLLVVIAILLTFVIKKSKKEGWDTSIKQKIENYEMVFNIMGSVIKNIDEELYAEMDDVLKALNDLYEKESVSKADVEMILEEAKDVFYRAKVVFEHYRDAQ